jgi:DNA-binding transcriptional MerR regulator
MDGCDTQRFFKVGKASKILGISTTQLRFWASVGTIRTIKTPGGHYLFDP